MKGWVGLVGSPCSRQFTQITDDVLPLCHATHQWCSVFVGLPCVMMMMMITVVNDDDVSCACSHVTWRWSWWNTLDAVDLWYHQMALVNPFYSSFTRWRHVCWNVVLLLAWHSLGLLCPSYSRLGWASGPRGNHCGYCQQVFFQLSKWWCQCSKGNSYQ